MESNTTNSPEISLHKRQYEDRAFTLQFIRKQVEKGTGKPLSQLKKEYSEEKLFFIALQFITTTKKALCKALNIEIDNACRYKRNYEQIGLLVQSTDEFRCPYTGDLAHLLSTNPNEFERLLKSSDTQLKMFGNE